MYILWGIKFYLVYESLGVSVFVIGVEIVVLLKGGGFIGWGLYIYFGEINY